MRVIASAILAVLFASTTPVASASEIDRSFNKRFDVEQGARLELQHEDGEVMITPWDQDVIEVDVRYRVEFRRVGLGRDPDLDVTFEQRDGVVRVIGEESSSGGVGFFSSNQLEYVYRVSAPAWVALEIRGEDGDVEIEGWRAEVSVRNDDGDVRLSDLQVPRLRLDVEDGDVDIKGIEGKLDVEVDDGDVTLRDCRGERIRIDSEDGNIQLDDCEGNFDLETDDGDIEVTGLHAGKLEVRTSDGRVDIEVDAGVGEIDFEVSAEDGAVDLELGDVSGAFTLSSNDGDIRVNTENEVVDGDHGRVSGKVGDGAGQIRVSTDRGRITLRH